MSGPCGRGPCCPSSAGLARHMTKEEYIRRFDLAATRCRDFAQSRLIEVLPDKLRFDVDCGATGTKEGPVKIIGGRLVDPSDLVSMEYIPARRMLWVDGKVPRWVDFRIRRLEVDATIIEIRFSDKLVTDDSTLWHKGEGVPPFHVLGPPCPRGWRSLSLDGRFSLQWQSAHSSGPKTDL